MRAVIQTFSLARSADPLVVTDHAGRIRYLNDAAGTLLEARAGETLGRPCWEVLRLRREDGAPHCRPDCEILRAARAGHPSPRRRVRADGRGQGPPLDLLTVLHPTASRAAPAIVHLLIAREPARHDAERPPLDTRAVSRLSLLSPREREVLRLLASGFTTDRIAEELGIARTTVRNHVRAILGKLRVHRRVEAVLLWLRAGGPSDPPSREAEGARRPYAPPAVATGQARAARDVT